MIMRKSFRINGRFRTVDLRRSPFSRYDFFLYGVVTGLVFAKLFFRNPIRSSERSKPSRSTRSASPV
jgi:hypothetical protein